MKRLLITGLMGLVAAGVQAGTAPSYINYGSVTTPPMIDATNFVNLGTFSFATLSPFEFSNVRNYTNRNVMANFGSGFRFDTAPSSTGIRRPAVNFYNAPLAGNAVTNASIFAQYQLLVSATNIVNRGVLSVGEHGLINLDGRNVDVSRGAFQVGTFTDRTNVLPEAVFDSAWGFGTSQLVPDFTIISPVPSTPVYDLTQFIPSLPYAALRSSLFPFDTLPAEVTGEEFIFAEGTNLTAQFVFLRNNNSNILTQIRSAPNPDVTIAAWALGIPMIEWRAAGTNALGQEFTNFLYLTDTYAVDATNDFVVNFPYSSQPPQSVPIPPATFQPDNYSITRSMPPGFLSADEGEPFVDPDPDFWTSNAAPERVTVSYSAYDARIVTTTTDPLQVTNLRAGPGRIELKATGRLDLNLARIDGLNFLSLQSTNHFAGASNASVVATYADVNLGSTNGLLNTTGLLKSTLPRFSGTISCYSAKWVNTVIHSIVGAPGQVTNDVAFHVLFVDSQLQQFTIPQVFNLSLRSTNILLGDVFNVYESLNLDAKNLTILSNGVISVQRDSIVWQDSAPNLRSLTNLGSIDFLLALNEVNFAGRNANGTDRPYSDFVNGGTITAAATRISATNVVNTGAIQSLVGPIFIQAVSNVYLLDGGFLSAQNADVSIACRNLYVTNHPLVFGRSLSLAVTGSLNFGPGIIGVLDGFHMLTKPATGDLSNVSVIDSGFAYSEVMHTWAGEDRGTNAAGYTNNAALGSLTLVGDIETLFTFVGTGPSSNALYVDVLILDGTAGNLDPDGNLTALNLLPGMKIYYSHAQLSDGTDMTAALAGKNGGSLVQLSHVGPLSFKFANKVAPLNLDLRVSVQVAPTPQSVVTWNTSLGATNYLYYLDPQQGTGWQVLTNFVSPVQGAVSHADQGLQSSRLYKVRVEQ